MKRTSLDEPSLAWMKLDRLAPLVARGAVSPVDLVNLAARRIARLNPRYNAFLALSVEPARRQALRAERELQKGKYRGPLHGIPISLKDNIWTRGIPTSAGSRVLEGFMPVEDATVARRLHQAGAILIGKTNLHEFAYGVTSENPHYGPVRNPWDTSRMTGGSSGGSAASLAAGMAWGSIGSDTGGSVRIPASLCGVVGLKPTFGGVSCHGVVPLSLSLDHVGPMATSVMGAAWLLTAIAGRDRRDPATRLTPITPVNFSRSLRRTLGRVRIGLPREHFFEGVASDVAASVETAARVIERLGGKIQEISLPAIAPWVEDAAQIAFAEARHYHESAGYFPSRAASYGEDVRRLLDRGGEIRAANYLAYVERMQQARRDWNRMIEDFDVLLAPATPIAAPLLGQTMVEREGARETVRAALLRLCRPANFTGAPALVLPCGLTRQGLPIGLQLIGPWWSEEQLLRIGYAYEQATEWHNRHPGDL